MSFSLDDAMKTRGFPAWCLLADPALLGVFHQKSFCEWLDGPFSEPCSQQHFAAMTSTNRKVMNDCSLMFPPTGCKCLSTHQWIS